MIDTEPVSQSDDGSQVSGILHIIEQQGERRGGNGFEISSFFWNLEESKHTLRGLLEAGSGEFFGADLCNQCLWNPLHEGCQRRSNIFCNKEAAKNKMV